MCKNLRGNWNLATWWCDKQFHTEGISEEDKERIYSLKCDGCPYYEENEYTEAHSAQSVQP